MDFSKWLITADVPVTLDRPYKPGFTAGGYVQLRYLEVLVPQVELLFAQRGTRTEMDGEDLGSVRLNYVDLALLARLELPLNDVTLHALTGPELSILLTAVNTNFRGFETDIKDPLTDIDIGAVVAAGIAVGPLSWGTITFEARYVRGLIDVTGANEEATTKNQTIAFLIGYEYRRDRDGDGIADSKDRCPRQAEDRDGFEDSDGCPDPDDDSPGTARYRPAQ